MFVTYQSTIIVYKLKFWIKDTKREDLNNEKQQKYDNQQTDIKMEKNKIEYPILIYVLLTLK